MARTFGVLNLLTALVVLALLCSCAQKVAITGGEKDTHPPALIKSIPDTFSTNFSAEKIRLDFDEFIQLNNVRKNLLITPVMRHDPTVLATNKHLIIKNIDDSLWPNTTYVLEFNEAIQDITERNSTKGFRYVFSTGDYIDSLSVAGELKNAFTLAPIEDAFVFLYETDEDSLPFVEKPRYIGRTGKDGKFWIQNMKKGRYKVFMSTDNNKNYLYDSPSELIDFLDSQITLSADTGQYVVGHLFKEEKNIQFLDGFGFLNKWAFYLSFKKSLDTLTIVPKQDYVFPEASFRRSYNEARDSVVFWLIDSSDWSEKYNLIVQADTFKSDTIELVYFEKESSKKLGMKNNIKGNKMHLGQDHEIYFDFPVLKVEEARIFLLKDTVLLDKKITLNGSGRKLVIRADWADETDYKIIFDSAAFTDISGNSNDSMARSFSTYEKAHYGTMEISLSGLKPGKGILMMLDKNKKIVEKVYLDNKISHFFQYLEPGEYFLKYIVDENGNGQWDPGNYLTKKHAEPVFIYRESITVRSNWDQVIEWKFN